MKGLVKIHELMQTHWLVRRIIHQHAPISPMPVRISYQIVKNIHHIIIVCIEAQDIVLCFDVMILGINLKCLHRYNRIVQGGHIFAHTDFFPVKKIRFIQHLLRIKASAYLACQQLSFNAFTPTVF